MFLLLWRKNVEQIVFYNPQEGKHIKPPPEKTNNKYRN